MQLRFPMSRKLILVTGDFLLLLVATYLAVIIVFSGTEPQDVTKYYVMLPVMVISAGILFNINGLFSLSRKKFSELVLSLGVSLFNLLIIMMAMSFFMREFGYSRGVLLLTTALQFALIGSWKYLFWSAEKAIIVTKNALIIGSEEECVSVISKLSAQPQLNCQVRYICNDCWVEPWEKITDKIDEVIICSDMSLKGKAKIVHYCNSIGKEIVLIPDIYGLFCSGVELDKIDDIPIFRPKNLRPTLEQRSLKRLLDIVVSATALLITWPIMLLVAIAIKLDSSGPILFSQVRTGRDEREFKVYKFRSMRNNAEKSTGPVLATENDPRITKLGNFMRATRLDELPQIFNVLFGDMSIVGPRPERPFFVEQFKEEIPEYFYRHSVKPGITGLAQVYGKYNTTPYNKLVYDLIYIQRCNALTDLVVMLQTVKVLVTKSSTEGAGAKQQKMDLSRYDIG
jgi:exopolysaccharide biosynthesis polyprenyl glycosylphosphotransferase